MDDLSIQQQTTVTVQDTGMPERSMKPVDQELTDSFQKIMEGRKDSTPRHDLESGKSKHDMRNEIPSAHTGETAAGSSITSMSSPLDSLFSGRMETAAPSAAQAPVMDQNQLESLVDRILVSSPEQGGQEVRISLNEKTLGGTEILLHRSADGTLSVTLNAKDPSAFQTLVGAQNDLQQLLQKQESAQVRVQVMQESTREENDSQRRSQTYQSVEELNER